MMDGILHSIMAHQMRKSGDGQTTTSPTPVSVLEPTPIDPTRIVTVPKVPFDSSPLGKIVDETVLAALCDVLTSHESSFRSSSSTPLTSLLLDVESRYYGEDVDVSKYKPECLNSWSEDGIQMLRNVGRIMVDFDHHEVASLSSVSGGDLPKVHPTRRNFSPCCSPEPYCKTIPVQDNNKSSMRSATLTPSRRSESFHIERASDSGCSTTTTFRINQTEQWYQRYLDLVKFRETYGHCLVPLHWPTNPSLAHWVKRQRHQYRAKNERKHSTLTPERQRLLEQLGFVWDSHASGWEERLKELKDFKDMHGHCRVPKTYAENPQLAIWVKCQRRQFKLYSEGKDSNMTMDRIQKLKRLGFVFTPRKQQRESLFTL